MSSRVERGDSSTHCGSGGANTHEYERDNGAGPHAVTEANLAGHGPVNFGYDDNGNMTSRTGAGPNHSFEYSAASQLEVICGVGVGCTFIAYGADRQRVAKWEYEGSGTSAHLLKLTHYVNGLEFEYEHDTAPLAQPSDAETIRRPVAGGGLELLERFGTAMLARLQVLHSDHLGSIVAVSDANGQIEARMAFDAWGQRRDPWSDAAWLQWTDLRPVWADAMLAITPRGFTGHEHLDRHGLIHMNGRVYDPRLGRFLQADPFIEDTSTLNRYTYVLNNPLSYSDPSGYFSFKDFIRTAISVYIAFSTGGAALAATSIAKAMAIGAAGGFLSGAVATGTWEGALSGAFVGAVAGGLGQGLQGASWAAEAGKLTTAGRFAHSAGVGVASGVTAELQGGKFGHSFLASMGAATTGELIGTLDLGSEMRFLAETVAGGTISEASGGKFANGAVTAAMNFAFASMGSGAGSSDPMDMSDAELDALIASRFDEDAFFSLDTAIAWQWGDPLPQWAVDFGAGLGDALTLTGTRHARSWIGIDGGVDQSSTGYTVGSWTAVASPAGGGRLLYAGAAKGYSIVAPSGAAASAFREGMKRPGRFWLGRNWRKPNLSVYQSDAALRAAAGRTNPYMNAYGAGVTYSGVTGPCYSAGSC